jgi:ABC-2 type transport system permease protein
MKQLKYVWFIAMKDLKLFTRDRFALLFALLFPFLFATMFYFLMSGAGSGDVRLELHLATQEAPGGMSYQILQGLETKDESQLKPGEPKIVWDKDYNEARQAVEDKKLAGFIAFPSDFTRALTTGSGTRLEIIANASDVNTRAALNGLAGAISSQIGTDQVIIQASVTLLVENGVIPADRDSIDNAVQQMMNRILSGGAAGAGTSYLTFRTDKVGEVEAENPSNWVIPGYLVMFVFFAAALTAESIVRERQNRTLERLLASSVRRESILGGIFTGTALRGLIQIIIFWTFGILVFHVDLGLSPSAVIILSVLMVLMSATFALMLATLARTLRSAASLAVITSLTLAPLGGCWWPSFLYPEWLQNVARITPHAWATSGFNKLMVYGASFGDVVPSMLALLGFSVIFGVIAVWRFRTSAV